MHTDRTLEILDKTTTRLGAEFRAFSDNTCSKFNTQELRREVEARKRRQLKAGTKQGKRSDGPRFKSFNLHTYKYHSLGDYVKMILQFGTTDSISTEPVSLSSLLLLMFR
jgi:hypothetical protein